MANSPSHKFGQIIGDLLEYIVNIYLKPIENQHNLYIDKKRSRKARNNKKEVIYTDEYGNKHKLDIVIEKYGTEEQFGDPIAFIEMAWRRYTKHSKNKAQEIQGAILPIIDKYSHLSPFYGCILAGVFTNNSIQQLKSHGFSVVYFEYETIIDAFSTVNIDVSWDEKTDDETFKEKIKQYESLTKEDLSKVADRLIYLNKKELDNFKFKLETSILRRIENIIILPLHGRYKEVNRIKDAIDYIETYKELPLNCDIVKYEIQIKYSNGDKINAEFVDRFNAINFLKNYSTI